MYMYVYEQCAQQDQCAYMYVFLYTQVLYMHGQEIQVWLSIRQAFIKLDRNDI